MVTDVTKEVAEARRSAADFRKFPRVSLFLLTFGTTLSAFFLAKGDPFFVTTLLFNLFCAHSIQRIRQDAASAEIMVAHYKAEEAAYLDQFQKHEGKNEP